MITFDGKTVISILSVKVPTQVFLQNRSAADVFVYNDDGALRGSTDAGTGIPSEGIQIPFGTSKTFERFNGTLYGVSAVAGAALVVMYNPSDCANV